MKTSIFFNEKPVRTLASLAQKDKMWYASMLCKETDTTYPHMMTILSKFIDEGLIESEEQGRIKIIKLTAHGEDLALDMQNLLRRMERGAAKSEPAKEDEKAKK